MSNKLPDIKPRRVRFSWEKTPLHWVPGDPTTTHAINALHLLLPAGERWFVHVFKQALPLVTDEELKERVKGFMGQEGTHAAAHQRVLDHMREQGLDPTPYVRTVDWLFERLLGDGTAPPGAEASWLRERLAMVAAIEHFTAVLGQWILDARPLDEAGADPVMLDLLRWHGAEEVEHRDVAFDLFTHLDGGYARRVRTMALAGPLLVWLLHRGARFLMANDPIVGGRLIPKWTHFLYRSSQGRVPTLRGLALAAPRYLRPGFHPSQEGDLRRALDYIALSPAHAEHRRSDG
ncbi:MAG: metal-dependent hydrolase [Nonomuraea sp.]|nr:metal-dependent hydrolase [Nonomuraea sp.]NUP68953.1 metal-dependent hydrolase [Nonomuraea sp.]NUP80004.1 metal-dependent hydrolase [Nonomuraea sp.]NUS07175.1 metal-dependent hydrolase [Nonomuraea sp.]NUT40647.1 metal-dependent hydrolase [Thermoactinospora sp.]